MRKAILVMLLAVVSSSAAAEWVEVARSDTSTFYADPATIRRAGNIVKMWDLIDRKTPDNFNNKPYMSQRSQHEYDCKEEQWRTLYFTFFSGNMAGGNAVYIDSDPGKWAPVPPGSIAEGMWKFACGR